MWWSSVLVICAFLNVRRIQEVTALTNTSEVEIAENFFENLTTTVAPSETLRHKNYEIIRSCLVPHPRIECDVYLSSGASEDNLEVECISSFPNRVLRVVGEYDVLTLNCKAGFNLDFDYNGFQPTEAIKILFWNEVQNCEGCVPQKQPKTYHMKVDVYSNKALHKFYLNEKIRRAVNSSSEALGANSTSALVPALAMIKCPRTGLFLVRGMHAELKKQEFGVYMFLEEPDVEPRLMHNNATKPYEVSSNRIMIPCRPSHYNAPVTLYRIHEEKLLPVSNGEFNPREGFNIPVESQRDLVIFQVVPTTFGMTTWRFQCSIGEHRLNMSYPGSDPENLFGFDAIPQVPSRNPQPPVNIEPNPVDLNPVTVNITCVIVTPDPNSRESVLATIDYGNPAEVRLRGEFVLPDYYNKSYSVHLKRINSTNATHEVKIFGAPMVGTYYCGSGATYNTIRAYALALNGKIYPLEFNTPYAELQHTSPPPEAHVQLKLVGGGGGSGSDPYFEDSQKNLQYTRLIAGRQYTFSCRIDTFTMGRTIIWELAYSNRTKQSYSMVYHFEGEFQNYTLEATWDLVHLSCSAAYWNMDLWQTDTLPFNIEGEQYISVTGGYMICIGAIFVLLVVILVLYSKYRSKNQWYFTRSEIREFHKGNPYVSLHNGLHDGGSNLPYDQRCEIDIKNFKIDSQRILGQGEFGIVYGGFVGDRPVGIKTVKNHRDKLLVKGLLAELKIQIHLGSHENIVQLVGAYTSQLRQGNVMVFLELCQLGSLESYLQRNRYYLEGINCIPSPYTRLAFTDPNCNKSDPCPLTVPDLYKWCYQIANGMSYLSEKKVIHADLATRNVLLTGDKTAKICDFGFSRRLRNYKIYMLKDGQSTPLPWAWMAPEALLDFAFSVQSDVWSFGVTVWEIFSLGARPYPGLNCGMEFVQRIKNGMRNHKPDLASMELYREVMRECWRYDPTDRPSFTELCLTLDYLLDTHAPSESRNQSLSSSSDSGVSVLHSSESAIAASCSNLNE